jgi:hypothetical protein
VKSRNQLGSIEVSYTNYVSLSIGNVDQAKQIGMDTSVL